jgi:hypothetical protein
MRTRTLSYDSVSLAVPASWDDITTTLNDAAAPLTIADPARGVGALQLSPAVYKGGGLPSITMADLAELLEVFASTRGLGHSIDRAHYSNETIVEGASFRQGDDYIRVWYVSDRVNLMLCTYVCEWNERHRETADVENAVRSLRFTVATHPE